MPSSIKNSVHAVTASKNAETTCGPQKMCSHKIRRVENMTGLREMKECGKILQNERAKTIHHLGQ